MYTHTSMWINERTHFIHSVQKLVRINVFPFTDRLKPLWAYIWPIFLGCLTFHFTWLFYFGIGVISYVKRYNDWMVVVIKRNVYTRTLWNEERDEPNEIKSDSESMSGKPPKSDVCLCVRASLRRDRKKTRTSLANGPVNRKSRKQSNIYDMYIIIIIMSTAWPTHVQGYIYCWMHTIDICVGF